MQAVFLAAPPPPPAGHPAVVAFWDLRRGLYVRGGTVSLTADGGRTFRVVLRRRQRITGLQAFDRRDAIVDLYDGRALRTLDGGRGWRAFTHRFGADFATARVGVGYRTGQFEFVKGLVFTRDDGRSWERLRSPCPRFAANSAGVELVTPLRGWIVCAGQPSAGQQARRSSAQVMEDVHGAGAAARAGQATSRVQRSRKTASASSGHPEARSTSRATAATTGSDGRMSPSPSSTSGAAERRFRAAAGSSS